MIDDQGGWAKASKIENGLKERRKETLILSRFFTIKLLEAWFKTKFLPASSGLSLENKTAKTISFSFVGVLSRSLLSPVKKFSQRDFNQGLV